MHRPSNHPEKNGKPVKKSPKIGKIDQNALDQECLRQDDLVRHFGRLLADAKRDYEQAKTEKDIFEAETSRRIRRKPGRYNVERLTEAAIKEVVMLEVLQSTAHEKVIKAKHKVDLMEITMRSLEHRKKALESLVYLHGQSYYATPKIRSKDRDRENQIRGLRDED